MDVQQEQEKYILKNVAEEAVKTEVENAMKAIEMCRCEKCFKDVCAIVLNQLKPMYVTTRRGELLGQIGTMKRPQEIDLTLKVAMACRMVSEHPMHEDGE